MSSQPERKPSDGVSEELVKDLLRREGLPIGAHVKLNVVTTRVRLDPDGTRTVLSQSSGGGEVHLDPRRGAKRIGVALTLACTIFGFAQLSYGIWARQSDAAVAPIFHANASCRFDELDPKRFRDGSPPSPTITLCRTEQAVLVDKHRGGSRSSSGYYLVTVTPNGKRDVTPLVHRGASQFWNRVRPTAPLTLQRFVAPGYRITGSVMALADSAGVVMSTSHPDSGTHQNLATIVVGGCIFALGLRLFVRARTTKA